MAAINDLISQIQDESLRNRIQEEVNKLAKQKKFGLVFEEHMPESTPLYDMPIKRGCNVMRRDSKDDKSIYVVLKVEGDTAVCVKPEQKDEAVTFELKDIVRVAEFGESIYPYLKPVDSVCNAPDSDLWHTLIEADNYHALQLLEYLYAGKVDCIYIDPPYNTGAKDWKYNNDYVDGSDAYRHSKWLSFMQRRLQLAKKLLNPTDSVLIVTIDEKEYLHLGCLLEEMFPEARMQMISSVINPAGAGKKEFARTDEYIFFLRFGSATLMSGVLLYTGSADKEGSLGGLVELGNIDQLIVLMKDAFQEALVCTNDPECLNNVPAGNNSNGAACHSCCMISETACENGNRMLDRGLIVPIDGRENQSYFKALVEELCQLEA